MGFFGGKKTTAIAPEAPALKPEDLGVVIHVMPKDFLGREASLRVEPKPTIVPVTIAAPAPTAAPVVILPPKRRVPLALWIVLALVLILGIGAVAYIVLTKAPDQVVAPVVVAPAPLPKTEPVVVPKVVEIPKAPAVPEQSKDSDSDGLTDIEERMYGTDYRNPDSDSDTFLDGNEVFHRYDPMGVAPSTLLDTGAVKVYSDTSLPFTIYYPLSWKVTADLAKDIVTFKTPALASVTVEWSAKDPLLTVEDWVLKNVKGIDITTLKSSYTKEGYYTLRSKDDLVAYVDGKDSVYTLTYALNTSLDISYIQTFAMMMNSLHIIP